MNELKAAEQRAVERVALDNVSLTHIHRANLSEVYLTAVPGDTGAPAADGEAERLYARAASLLHDRDAIVVQERLYGALEVGERVLRARNRVTAQSPAFTEVPATYLDGTPCLADGLAGLHLCAVVTGGGTAISRISHGGDAVGHLIEAPHARWAYLSGMTANGEHANLPQPDQATRMFTMAESILRRHNFAYRDVIRTWVYNADILDWYDEFNAARTAAYTSYGLLGVEDEYLPASTGIQARPLDGAACAMDVLAVQGPGERAGLQTGILHNPLQNEAYAYGSAFARAMEVVSEGVRTVYVSGTASIDEFGNTVHLDDIDGQIKRTVRNVEALIGTRGLTLDDICQATVFLKHERDLPRFEEFCAGTSLGELGVPMKADVCRGDLLFEIDAVAAKAIDV